MKPSEPRLPSTLTQWRRQLDKLLRQKTPLGLKDFPQLDDDIAEAFAEGVAVAEYFDDTVRAELEDLGFPYQDLDDEEVQERILAELEAQGFAGLGEDASGGPAMRPASNPLAAPQSDLFQGDDATERSEIRFGSGDPFGPLDSDDIESLQQQEAQRAARERRRCAHCGTVFHPVSPYAEDCPSLGRHEERCKTASQAERAFYAHYRRWPRPGQVDDTTEEAA